jgi:hypothetical protein
MTGTFDLSAGGDDNYATCSRCVRVVDPSVSGKGFFQQSGTLVVDATSDQLNGLASGTLTNITLIQVNIDPNTFVSTPVPNGACLHLASAAFQIGPPPGWMCNPSYYGDGDCDCGCGAVDSDCPDATVGSCDYCDDIGSCNTDFFCPGTIDPANNATCTP